MVPSVLDLVLSDLLTTAEANCLSSTYKRADFVRALI